jgi:hypothetical protein
MTSTASRAKVSPRSTSGLAAPVLLDDAQVMAFVNRGYHLVETDFPVEFHRGIIRQLEAKPDHYATACSTRCRTCGKSTTTPRSAAR